MPPETDRIRNIPTDLSGIATPERCALLIIDMQNDFCHDDGYVSRVIGKDVSPCQHIAENVGKLLTAARSAHIPVLWLIAHYAPEIIGDNMLSKQIANGTSDQICCENGRWGADFYGPRPIDGEAVFEKHSYSGFSSDAFSQCLEELQVTTLIFAGVQTNICVESTLRDAHSRGYFVAIPADCVASHTPKLHEATLANVKFLFGYLTDAAELKTIWQQA